MELYTLIASEYIGDELNLFEQAHNWKRYWFSVLEPYAGKRVLDVGAGVGATAALFSDKELDCYMAVEPDSENVKIIERKAAEHKFSDSFEYRIGGLGCLNEQISFDTILYIDVLEHILEDAAEMNSAAQRLIPGGRLIVLAPAHQWLFSPFDVSVGHFRRYDKKSLMAAKPQNLEVERLCYLDSVGVLASAANRMILRSELPTEQQIKVWDRYMVPVSRFTDKLTRFLIGKSIFAVFRLPESSEISRTGS